MPRYLVTGVAGFIGASVAAQLLLDGHEVLGLDNLNQAYDTRLKEWRLRRLLGRSGFEFRRVDITDRTALEGACGEGDFEAVINLAARAGVRQSVRSPREYFETNLQGTLNLLDLARGMGITKFVQASTSSLYGAHNPLPFSEAADISRPLSPYAASKGAAEMLCHAFHHLHGLHVAVLRYFTVYGPAGRPAMSVFRFIQWIAEGRPVRLYGDGHQERDFTFVEDIARGTVAAIVTTGYEVFNLGGDRPNSILETIRAIEAVVGRKATLETHATAPADLRSTWADIGKARARLSWEPSVSFPDGLKACVDWYMAERSWAQSIDTSD